jgi:SH3 domain-containing YSC84-like protein 1
VGAGAGPVPPSAQYAPAQMFNPARLEGLRSSLDRNSRQLLAILSPEWQQYLALPPEVYNPTAQPRLDVLRVVLARYDQVAKSTSYGALVARPEFQATYELLREYAGALAAAVPGLQLPPPPPLN